MLEFVQNPATYDPATPYCVAGAIFLAAKFLKPKYDHLLHGQFDAIYGAHARARAPTCAHPLSVRGTADILCRRGVLVAVVWLQRPPGLSRSIWKKLQIRFLTCTSEEQRRRSALR